MATNDALKALLENELLTDDVKKSVEDAFAAIVEEQKTLAEDAAATSAAESLTEALASAKSETEKAIRLELAEKFVTDRKELIKSLDESVKEMLAVEIEDLKESIEAFRDLEVEYVAKLEDEKVKLAETFSEQKKVFVKQIDEFVETRLTAEIKELTENIDQIAKNQAGMEMFEAFVSTYEDTFADKDAHVKSVKARLAEMESEKAEALEIAEALGNKVVKLERSKALDETLAPLSGKRKAVMGSILEGFEPSEFSNVYKKMIVRVMDTVAGDSTEVKAVVESVVTPETIEVIDGNDSDRLDENEEVIEESVELVAELNRLRKMAGIVK